ncbi:MAG: PTPA-CTERM sorting domain-containing protein [Leptolyngbyaceae cyanobacterium]
MIEDNDPIWDWDPAIGSLTIRNFEPLEKDWILQSATLKFVDGANYASLVLTDLNLIGKERLNQVGINFQSNIFNPPIQASTPVKVTTSIDGSFVNTDPSRNTIGPGRGAQLTFGGAVDDPNLSFSTPTGTVSATTNSTINGIQSPLPFNGKVETVVNSQIARLRGNLTVQFLADNTATSQIKVSLPNSGSIVLGDPPPSEIIPTPAMLPGLISMGIAAWRKRRQEEMAGEQEADPVLEEV